MPSINGLLTERSLGSNKPSYCFSSYVLESFNGNTLLRYETISTSTDSVVIPPFIKIAKEVTTDPAFSTLGAAATV